MLVFCWSDTCRRFEVKKRLDPSLNVEDIQGVAEEILDRKLTKKEVGLVEDSVGDYLDWFQAIENAINRHVPK